MLQQRALRTSHWLTKNLMPVSVAGATGTAPCRRGCVDHYDGETLFLRRNDEVDSRFGILPKAIATLDEDPQP